MKKTIPLLLFLMINVGCTTSRGLGPVDTFLNETGGKKYYTWLAEKETDENLSGEEADKLAKLRSNLLDTRVLVEDLREREYNFFAAIFGKTFERDLIPLDEFLDDETGEIFAYQNWIKEKLAAGEIDDVKANRYLRELDVMQDIVDALMEGRDPSPPPASTPVSE